MVKFSDKHKNRNGHGTRHLKIVKAEKRERRVIRGTPDHRLEGDLELSVVTFEKHGTFPRCANASCTFRVPEPDTLCPRCLLSGQWIAVNRLLNRDHESHWNGAA